ncbi:MAG: hypothetical protein J6Z02_07185, partial [Lachnospiraceae bacterium]|nr:hypothetical protein [Lachnospiraceae bacterium]
ISVGTDEKSGKLKATALANVDSELSGIIESESSSFTYTLWEDENNNAVLKIPGTTEYAVNISSTYTPEEREEIPGFVYDEPAKDEEGNYIITEVSMAGFIDGETVYEIRGLAKGSATITFTSPDESKVITVEIEIDEDHKVKVLSHKS